ncbi:MAG: hypothetical protein QOF78_4165 [Phycisphaerales bacterium]|jgi:hypothetical protein|nr:hypothetical protein [Phycisphaerales bacterium]
MAKINWTQGMRRRVYSQLLNQFGPHATWGKHDYPNGREPEYRDALRALAVEFGHDAPKWEAVRQQVRFGITQQGVIRYTNHFRSLILNKAAALEEGFIAGRDLPSRAEFDRAGEEGGDEEEQVDAIQG